MQKFHSLKMDAAPWSGRRMRRLLPVVALAAALPALSACHGEEAKASAGAPPPAKVGVVTVKPQAVTRRTELPGRLSAYMVSDVRPQVSGIILKRLFTEGGEVKKGEPLYQIDAATYQAAYDSASAQLQHDQAVLAAAKAKAESYGPLLKSNTVSQQDYRDTEAAAKEAEADIASAKASLEQASINLRYTKVLAPISGTIGRSSVTPGALVTANQSTALATVTQLDPIYVDMNQSATTLLRLKQEMAAGQIEKAGDGSAKVTLKLDDGTVYPLPGKLQFTEVTVNQGTGTVLLRALFPNPDHLLLPGMFVHAEIEEGVNRNGILLPQPAVSRNTHGDPTVLVVGEGNKVSQKIIQTGEAIGNKWVVTGGLKPGEKVIVDGIQNAQPGTVIDPVAPLAADSKAAS